MGLGLLPGCGGENEEQLIASARGYIAKRDFAAAIIELKGALGKNANSGDARLLMGRTLLETGDPVAAEVELRKALELGVKAEQVLPALGQAMLLLGQPAKVIAQFGNTALDDATAQADLKSWIAAAYAQQGELAKANAAIDAALASQPLHATALIVQARLKAGAGDVDGALATLDTLLAKQPDNQHAGVARGYLLWLGKNDAAGALAAHRKVLAAHPNSVAAQAEIVSILFREHKAGEAREQFGLLKKMAPAHPQTTFFDAQFAYVDKQYKRSRELVDALLKLDPDNVRALELAAAAEYQLGNDIQAQAFAARALKVMPGLVLARQIHAQSLLRAGEAGKAAQVLAPLVEAETADAESLALAGRAFMLAGDAKRADAAFVRAARLAPDSSKVRTEAALSMIGGPRADVALRDLEAVAAGDASPRADLALISARIAKQDLRGALKAVDGLEAKMPNQPLPHQLRGQVLAAQRDGAGARRSFEAALAKDRAYFPATAALASMEVAAGKPDLARKRLLAHLEHSPGSARVMMMLADIPAAGGLLSPQSIQHLADAVRADPRDPEIRLALIARLAARGDRRAALTAAQEAAAALPDDLAILDALGATQLLAGEAQQAISTFSKLAGLQPKAAAPQIRLAEAHEASGDLGGAARALRKAVEIEPNHGAARRGLAMLALRDKRPQDALAIAREMQKREPKGAMGAMGHLLEGDIEAQRKNWAAAASAYRSALQLGAASEAAIKLHVALRAANKPAEADRVAAEWERARPNDPVFRFYLGDVATQRNDFAAAEAQYRAVLTRQPDNANALNNIAWLMHQQKKAGALEIAAKANALLPNRAPILDTLAMLQMEAGLPLEAVKTQQQAVEASPRDPNLKLALARYLIKAGKREEARDQLQALVRLGDSFKGQGEVAALMRTL
ncbi:MAG: PEP-CTERM system TPR-repeat protein PrsT [Betaproteobacteria bacterium]|nr:PEP-CTERM system TPR-repeat protein PrsT [Betaproteobacteria bacterium]